MNIDVSLEVYKALTARLTYEGQSYDDVIRDLLNLDSPVENEFISPLSTSLEGLSVALQRASDPSGGFYSRGLRLPNGTVLRARYKGQVYSARIEFGEFLGDDGHKYTSPSAAASAITQNNVNGLRFWEAQRPGDLAWRRLDTLVPA